MDLREQYRARVQAETRGAANALVDIAFQRPFLNTRMVEAEPGVSKPAALRALRLLEDVDVLDSVPEGPDGQLRWLATEVFELLTNESEPAAS